MASWYEPILELSITLFPPSAPPPPPPPRNLTLCCPTMSAHVFRRFGTRVYVGCFTS